MYFAALQPYSFSGQEIVSFTDYRKNKQEPLYPIQEPLYPIQEPLYPIQEPLYPIVEPFSSIADALVPFNVFTRIVRSNCLQMFIEAVDLISLASKRNKKIPETSCIHNLKVLIVLFSGAAKAKRIVERLIYMSTTGLTIDLANNKKWDYKILSLFAGDLLLTFRRNLSEEENNVENRNRIVNLYNNEVVKEFIKFTEPLIIQCLSTGKSDLEEAEKESVNRLKLAWNNLDYNFNKNVLTSLTCDLDINRRKTDEKTSFVYYINVMLPSCYKDSANKHYRIYHAFLIEQFFYQRQPYHRIYSAWEEFVHPLDFFEKKGYKINAVDGCLNYSQMIDFMKDFSLLFCKSTNASEKSAIRKKLFEYDSPFHPPILFFDENSSFFKGLSLRYEVCQVDPSDCIKHFNQFIESEGYKNQLRVYDQDTLLL